MIRLAVRCCPDQADLVLAELTVLAPNGVEEERGPGYVEYAIYGGEGELPELGEIDAAVGAGRVEVSSTEVPDDWADRWRDFHKPLLVGERLWLRPSWEEPREGAIDLVVDPGQAFGTGAHPDHPPLPRVPARAGGRGRGERPAHRPRQRLRRPRDRRREARLVPGHRLRPRAAPRSRRRPRTPTANDVELELRAHEPARIPPAARPDRRRQHDLPDPEGSRRPATESGRGSGRGLPEPPRCCSGMPSRSPTTSSARACSPRSSTRSPPPSRPRACAEHDRRRRATGPRSCFVGPEL